MEVDDGLEWLLSERLLEGFWVEETGDGDGDVGSFICRRRSFVIS